VLADGALVIFDHDSDAMTVKSWHRSIKRDGLAVKTAGPCVCHSEQGSATERRAPPVFFLLALRRCLDQDLVRDAPLARIAGAEPRTLLALHRAGAVR